MFWIVLPGRLIPVAFTPKFESVLVPAFPANLKIIISTSTIF